eukprot:1150768-Pelagomonas_calceolata.AAC.8
MEGNTPVFGQASWRLVLAPSWPSLQAPHPPLHRSPDKGVSNARMDDRMCALRHQNFAEACAHVNPASPAAWDYYSISCRPVNGLKCEASPPPHETKGSLYRKLAHSEIKHSTCMLVMP